MCGRLSLITPVEAMARLFRLDDMSGLPNLLPRYNIAPTMDALVMAETRKGKRRLGTMRWGLVPPWSKSIDDGPVLFNARSETIATKRSFSEAFRNRRCVVLADSFFEWQKGPNGTRQAYRVLTASERPFAMAGVWEQWSNGDQSLLSVAIVTSEANDIIKPLHHRMPVIIPDDKISIWIQEDDPKVLASLMGPYPSELIKAYPVDAQVGKISNDGPELWKEVEAQADAQGQAEESQLNLFR